MNKVYGNHRNQTWRTLMPRGKLIVLDGPEGAGKTTAWRGLQEVLPKDKYVFSREPGGTPFSETMRGILLDPRFHIELESEFLLFWIARVEHISKIIRPALLKGQNVILDRFDSSTFAIQLWGRENYAWMAIFAEMRNFVCKDVTPDLYIYMQIEPYQARLRLENRTGNNHFDSMPLEFHERVNIGYRKYFETLPHTNLDATQAPEKVLDDVKNIICEFCA